MKDTVKKLLIFLSCEWLQIAVMVKQLNIVYIDTLFVQIVYARQQIIKTLSFTVFRNIHLKHWNSSKGVIHLSR